MDNNLRHQIGQLLGIAIPPKGWEKKFNELSQYNRFTSKEISKVLVVILEHLENIEEQAK